MATEPTPATQLINLLHREFCERRGTAIVAHGGMNNPTCVVAAGKAELAGLLTTGVSSSEVSPVGLSPELRCPRCGGGYFRCEDPWHEQGVRSSEVDGLREALLDIEQWSKGLGPTMSNNDPDAGRGTLGRIHRRATDALTGVRSSGPKVEPEP